MATFPRGTLTMLPPTFIRREALELKQQQLLNSALQETSSEVSPNRVVGGRPAGDERTMRGIPIIGSGCGGAIMGTQPETEVERKLDGLLKGRAA